MKQLRVLDCDNGLSSEILNDFDLLIGEGPDLVTADEERTDQFASIRPLGGVRERPVRRLLTQFDERMPNIVCCDEMQSVAIPATDNTVVGIAEPNGTGQDAGKNRLGIGG